MNTKNRQYGVWWRLPWQMPKLERKSEDDGGELKRLVDAARYDWVSSVVKSFKFEEFRKGLRMFCAHALSLENGVFAWPCMDRNL